jgi:peroxiredoxin
MRLFSALIAFTLFLSGTVLADAEIGQPAPAFTLKDTTGKMLSLKDFKGKVVVLEWLNFDCPFVKKHYGSGNMQKLQAAETANGAVWLSIASSAKGKEGYYDAKGLTERNTKHQGKQTAILFDTDGKTGKAYGAKTTPHLYVIDKDGKLAYRGAIDDKPSTDQEDIATSKNYVTAALEDLRAGRKVANADTKPYGCGVKYK